MTSVPIYYSTSSLMTCFKLIYLNCKHIFGRIYYEVKITKNEKAGSHGESNQGSLASALTIELQLSGKCQLSGKRQLSDKCQLSWQILYTDSTKCFRCKTWQPPSSYVAKNSVRVLNMQFFLYM